MIDVPHVLYLRFSVFKNTWIDYAMVKRVAMIVLLINNTVYYIDDNERRKEESFKARLSVE
jgi:hypothetical protein